MNFGIHNIPLMGSGDWNDGMSTVGNEGKGESVWLGWFLYSILESFIEIADKQNDKQTKEHFEERREFIRDNLEKNAWDGAGIEEHTLMMVRLLVQEKIQNVELTR